MVGDRKVADRDCGNNFYVSSEDLGKPMAKVVLDKLLEMNPDVSGQAIEKNEVEASEDKQFIS